MTNNYLGIDIDYSRDSLFDELGIKRLRESYMKDEETSPQQRYAYVAKAFGSNPEHAQRLYDYASKHWLSFSTPILSFGRSQKGLPISCFLNLMMDSSAGLVDTLSETNWLSMLGGGVGIHVRIRSADEKSVGVMPHMKIYDASCLAYRQGRTRRGSYAMYLDISHPDIIQFLEIRKPTGDQNIRCLNLHHGINIPDSFMEIIERCMLDPNADDTWELKDPHQPDVVVAKVSAKELWQRIIEIRMQTGEPYLHFIDTANRALPQWLKEKGLEIQGSNLCLTGDTRVVTDRGYLTLSELYEQGGRFEVASDLRTLKDSQITPKCWGTKVAESATVGVGTYSSSPVILTSTSAEVYELTTKGGYSVKGTLDHGVLTTKGWKTIGDIEPGDTLLIQSGEGMWSSNATLPEFEYEYKSIPSRNKMMNKRFTPPTMWTQELGEMLGWLVGDRFVSSHHGYATFVLGKNDVELREKIITFVRNITDANVRIQEHMSSIQLIVEDVRFGSWIKSLGVKCTKSQHKQVPHAIWSAPREAVVGFLRGLFSAGGRVNAAKDTLTVQLDSTSKTLLQEVQSLLSNFGIRSSIYAIRPAGTTMSQHSLRIGESNTQVFANKIGFLLSYKSAKLAEHTTETYIERFEDKVVSKTLVGTEAVFDIMVNESHSFIANGLVVHNCAEIELPTSEERTAVCCLSSLNLEYYDQWQDNYQFIRDVAEMLDNVLTYFIEHAPDTISRAKFSAMRERSIGIGVLGFHSYLQSHMIPFESALAKSANLRIFNNIKNKLDRANKELATERGEAPDAVGYGVRFSHTMAIAPTASSSIIMGNTSPSIEPMRANAYRQDTLSGAYLHKNKFLDKLLKERISDEVKYQETWKAIISNDGSVQDLDILTQDEKDVFKTAMEIDQRWIIDLAADRAPLIDQGQSVNVFFRPDSDIRYLHAVHFSAWKKGIKALYYCRSDKLRKADKVSQRIERKIIEELDMTKVAEGDECLACQ